ncbi:patatin-like phospholipase family protein [Ideonella sp. YS5]|uniref:patatin-like phospholipase family protein n=1 Tax=Ideonella sp. YS5 TaxID=3453714 RepID=UPI003EE81FCB
MPVSLLKRSATAWLACAALALLAGCSTTRPWQNLPDTRGEQPSPAVPEALRRAESARSIVAAVTLSGGGARAAAFGLGVLRELKGTRFEWDGRQTTLLDEVSLVSGVSGGSVLAAHFAAFGDETLDRFEHDFLLDDFEFGLVGTALSPRKLYQLGSPWYGRSNVLAERLDVLYRGRTFGDLRNRRGGPDLLVTATDLTTGSAFEFSPEQFALICSDLDSVPLSFAVAASSAVPILLTPVTLRNHAGQCPRPREVDHAAAPSDNFRARLFQNSARSYLDASERPYLHLVDGGLADNLGVRGLLDRMLVGGSIDQPFRDVPPGTIRRLVLVAVNSERDMAERIDKTDRVPSTAQVMDALIFGAGSRGTQETLAILNDDIRRWAEQLRKQRGAAGSPFAADAEIHVISVSLRDVPDEEERQLMLQVPTAFTITPADERRLQEAGRAALRASAEYQRLKASLKVAD